MPEEGITVIIKVGANCYTAHVVYSGGAMFYCVSPIEEAEEISPSQVEEWAYIEKELSIIEY